MKNFIPCIVCGKKATWSYMPGIENYCDKHVGRGCSCNMELKEGIDHESEAAKDPANYIEIFDGRGRRLPCCEYSEISEECHNESALVKQGWEAYYEQHPEQRRESEEVEHWEHKLGV